ncbi:Bax inhibitor-1/YccA family protein [Alicyclobacillus fructus]|uniref:Bax inhibitor-1/YccA family protein n=1 Tax=Alicyclobacillus fructus TaxID=2816082 RepID=UPI001A8C7D94|nr:Bax inhibitor-1/YccA family protein [Alicyclobacillus fructus]
MQQTYTITQNKILSRVFLGLCVSLVTAGIGVVVGTRLPYGLTPILWLVELGMIVYAMFRQYTRAIGYPFVFTFTFISGMTLSYALMAYASAFGMGLVLKALAVTAGAFLVASFVASRTSMDFSFLGGFLMIGTLALLLMGLVAMFTGFSSAASLIYAYLGVAIFIGYVLFDVNRLAQYGVAEQHVPWMVLSLYLDFINLFLFILRLMGIMSGGNDRR